MLSYFSGIRSHTWSCVDLAACDAGHGYDDELVECHAGRCFDHCDDILRSEGEEGVCFTRDEC